MTRYSGDPYWITAKFGQCGDCRTDLKGKRAYFYPKSHTAYCEECGKKHEAEFAAATMDEDFYTSQY